MKKFSLTEQERESLIAHHRASSDGRERDRIKAILLRDDGWNSEKIAHALLLDRSTVNRHLLDYVEKQKLQNEAGGSESKLNDCQEQALVAHLAEKTYQHKHQIVAYVKAQYGVDYTISGMQKWLERNGFSYKQPKGVPYKACSEKQAVFVQHYEELKDTVGDDEPILFMDAVHPTQATKITHGWIKKGIDKAVATNASRTRLNILGAIRLGALQEALFNRFDCNINSEVINVFLPQLRQQYPDAKKIHLIMDQAGYHKAHKVHELAEKLNIKIHFLPPHSPNLNPIERLWKVMNKMARNNRFFKTSSEFRQKIDNFFKFTFADMAQDLDVTINDNFQRL